MFPLIPPEPFVVLHGGAGTEIALIEYLSRVLLHLLAIGSVAALAYWGADAVGVVHSVFATDRDFVADRENREHER